MAKHLADTGFLTFACGQDYLMHARLQAMSIKLTQKKHRNFAVIVDAIAAAGITHEDHGIFDSIIPIDHTAEGWDMSQEWRAFALSPWQHTIKTDADMVFTSSIDHWWVALRHRDLCVTTRVHDYRGQEITSRSHRKLFDENNLPNVYSALTYFRYSQHAHRFFSLIKDITHDWDWFSRDFLIKNEDHRPRTDEIYAIAAVICDSNTVTWPANIPSFVHMKEKLNGLSESTMWYKQLPSYWYGDKLYVGNHRQVLPFHYHQKGWINEGTYASIHRDHREFHGSHGRMVC